MTPTETTDPSLRIGLFTHSTNPRGGVVHALELGEALAARGHDVAVHAPAEPRHGFFPPPPRPRPPRVSPAPPDAPPTCSPRRPATTTRRAWRRSSGGGSTNSSRTC